MLKLSCTYIFVGIYMCIYTHIHTCMSMYYSVYTGGAHAVHKPLEDDVCWN